MQTTSKYSRSFFIPLGIIYLTRRKKIPCRRWKKMLLEKAHIRISPRATGLGKSAFRFHCYAAVHEYIIKMIFLNGNTFTSNCDKPGYLNTLNVNTGFEVITNLLKCFIRVLSFQHSKFNESESISVKFILESKAQQRQIVPLFVYLLFEFDSAWMCIVLFTHREVEEEEHQHNLSLGSPRKYRSIHFIICHFENCRINNKWCPQNIN